MLENQKILAISGKKGSGKNTACNFIHSLILPFFKCTPQARVDPENGALIVLVEDGEEGILDLNNRTPEFLSYMEQHVWPFVRKFSFAERFKRICVEVFNLSEEQVYGTDEQKNTLTKFKWEDMPVPPGKVNIRTGLMTAREFMQYYGSEIGRSIYENVWVDALERDIVKSLSGIAIIDDCRFPNEVAKIKEMGGWVIRLTRDPYKNGDNHNSEVDLDPDVYDWSNFDKVIDNENMTIEQLTEEIYKTLIEFNWVEE